MWQAKIQYMYSKCIATSRCNWSNFFFIFHALYIYIHIYITRISFGAKNLVDATLKWWLLREQSRFLPDCSRFIVFLHLLLFFFLCPSCVLIYSFSSLGRCSFPQTWLCAHAAVEMSLLMQRLRFHSRPSTWTTHTHTHAHIRISQSVDWFQSRELCVTEKTV